MKLSQITNTVYYYPLVSAVRSFLKSPIVKIGTEMDRFEIIRNGVENFNSEYGEKQYSTGAIAKLAIYCSNIEVLEEEVYPFLVGQLKIDPDHVLKFHKGNRQYPQPADSEIEFRSLDQPQSRKRFILLVQVGKEGWDCPSLTGVILSQQGDSPRNMILQTSCRCLRQVDGGEDETALIWLNDYNAKILNDQLKKEQHTSIQELNSIRKAKAPVMIDQVSRMEILDLPEVDFYQLKITYQSLHEEQKPNSDKKLQKLLKEIDTYRRSGQITTTNLGNLDEGEIEVLAKSGIDNASFTKWVNELIKSSFMMLNKEKLIQNEAILMQIFKAITYDQDGRSFWNEQYDKYKINNQIRLAFSISRSLETKNEVVPENASLLLVDKLKPAVKSLLLYPEEDDVKEILKLDKKGGIDEVDIEELKQVYENQKIELAKVGMEAMLVSFEQFVQQKDYSLPIRSKDRSFHYLPYDFRQSAFEKDILTKVLQLKPFKDQGLELYYNGERGLTEFVIKCYEHGGSHWKYIGRYTTDFLLIQREQRKLNKVLMVETKGEGYSRDPEFLKKKAYVESEFLEQNKEKLGYARFDFIYIEDSNTAEHNTRLISEKIESFFTT